MTREDDVPGLPPDAAAAAVNQVEGYLLVQAEWDTARREGEEFARRMPWLTTGQHEEVARHYAEQRMLVTRQTLRRIAARADELRGEYQARYDLLRERVMRLAALAVCAAVLWSACLTTWAWWYAGG
ncbi:hypothetical protein [Streptomyces minutiscleroticus]|uniref:Cytochrome C oxidase subunit I n=1 Tax=Streptomyces minutiscleroticus TaxID=68238 RepID=A0A918KRW0_9ACTN|nr:hypothetical protein [Streptomyces minutiscleroticus]GGX73613.1 hypothetical protein GCM10010358_30180 [Streptomyces minutiscleroticus]